MSNGEGDANVYDCELRQLHWCTVVTYTVCREAEDQLRDKNVGCFLIRLSEKAIGYILSYK